MLNYYDILKVSPQASSAEVKSAYRRLARKLHPDSRTGSEETALKFAAIAEAYEVLGNVKERMRYDQRLLEVTASLSGTGATFAAGNPHVQRWRQMVYEKRYNDIIDRMIAEERLESMAFQKVVYPLVAFLVTTLIVTTLKPRVFANSDVLGKFIIVTLFIVGVIHIIGRLRDGFERFTEHDDDIHESILDESDRKTKPFSRLNASGLILGGAILCSVIGLLIGMFLDLNGGLYGDQFYHNFNPAIVEFVFYPPIVTFFVDMIHSVVSKFES